MRVLSRFAFALAASAASFLLPAPASGQARKADVTLLNASYDSTRELYARYNQLFSDDYYRKTGTTVAVRQSHASSGGQSRAVQEGLDADVVTLALGWDIDALADKRLVAADWQKRRPQNSVPYASTVVFLVRAGNPKNLRTWEDLIRPGVAVITPNPKTSGGARWNFLAGYGALWRKTGSEERAQAYMKALYAHVPVLDTGARGATLSFAQKGLGDVLLAWENEAELVRREFGRDKFAVVTPPESILAEPVVALVDRNADKHGTRAVAEAYLNYLYSPEAQALFARSGYRAWDAAAARPYAKNFPKIVLFTLADVYGDWRSVQKKFFADGGVFDRLYGP